MAVSNDLYTPTESLILAKPRRHFRTGVRWQHWQLRSLIGIDSQNVIYFPVSEQGNIHVQRLNTKTRETETVKRLSFMPRCLVARNGWVCCGGEGGNFASFRVGDGDISDSSSSRSDLSMDVGEPATSSLLQSRSEKSPLARHTVFGKDRVNCITLWFPPKDIDRFEGAYDQEVAVLANNDSTVMVVSLRDQEALDKITYPDFMNRGVISPDGRILIAISDDPYLYIHERRRKRPEGGRSFGLAQQQAWEWCSVGKIQLKSQSKDDRSDNRGSFAACFSSTGKYLAVGTQYGTISIFNVDALTQVPDVDPLLTYFTTSRPNAQHGAVRDMAFSPGPSDLLAWTEDRGRVGIADIRTGFDSRQILYLDKPSDFEQLPVTDKSTIDPRLLERAERGERGETSTAEHGSESQQNRSSASHDTTARLHSPLSLEDTVILEAFQDARRRQDHSTITNRASIDSSSVSGNSGGGGGSSSGGGGSGGNGSGRRRGPWVMRPMDEDRSTGTRTINEIIDNLRELREREAQERLRARDENAAERRRYATNPFTGATSTATLGATGSGTGRSLLTRLMASASNPASAGGWDVEAALYDPPPTEGSGFQSPPPTNTNNLISPTGLDFRAFANLLAQFYRAAYIMRDWEDPTRRLLNTYNITSHVRPGPYDTAGLSWSENGDTLFVGAENGIFEFRVNLFGRKLSPDIRLA